MSDSDTASVSSGSITAIDPTVPMPSINRAHPPFRYPPHPVRRSSIPQPGQPSAAENQGLGHIYGSQRRNDAVAVDRKRRLTSSAVDSGRRRHPPAARSTDIQELDDSSEAESVAEQEPTMNAPAPEIIDLTSSPTMPHRQRLPSRTSSSSSRRYLVPRWQHDSEANECPICRKPFTWLFRRHHCRKCGRVVCSECSPHRITIPRQFIVNPPDLESFSPQDGSRRGQPIDLTVDDDDDENNDSRPTPRFQEGGEKVRLCNPCVPDPQPEPPPNFPSAGQTIPVQSRSPPLPSFPRNQRPHTNILGQISRNQPPYPTGLHQSNSVPGRSHGFSYGPRVPMPSTGYRPRSTATFDEILASGPSTQIDGRPGFANNPLPPLPSMYGHGPRHASMDSRARPPIDPYRRPRGNSLYAQHMRDLAGAPAPRPPRPRLNEEDICPVCRRALPPKGPDGSEAQREAHIMDCITSREPATRGGGEGSSSRPGTLHMIAFTATEKDCVGEEGNTPECSICMVEYDPGDELARLECFCKFHKVCIVSWLNRKAECPVHKASSMHY